MATETQIEQVRRRIGDSKKSDTVQFTGNGEETLFSLPHQNVFDVKVYINSTEVPTAGYTVNGEAGKVIISEAPPVDSTIRFDYYYAGYTDEQIGQMVDDFGVEGAVIETLQGLLADSARFYDYSQGQTTDKRSQIFDHLKDMLATAKAELLASTTPDLAIGNRNTGSKRKKYALDLTRDDTFSSPVDGYSSNNV